MKTGVFFNSVLLCTTEKHRQFVCAPVICSLWLLQLSCIVDVRRYTVGRILYKQINCMKITVRFLWVNRIIGRLQFVLLIDYLVVAYLFGPPCISVPVCSCVFVCVCVCVCIFSASVVEDNPVHLLLLWRRVRLRSVVDLRPVRFS